DTRSACTILLVEVASRPNALTHRAEVVRARRQLIGPGDAFGKLAPVLENEVTSNESAAERRPVYCASSLDAGDGAQLLEHTSAEFPCCLVGAIDVVRQVDGGSDDIRRIEPELHRAHVIEAAQKEPGADEQHERGGDLAYDQHRAKTRVRPRDRSRRGRQ